MMNSKALEKVENEQEGEKAPASLKSDDGVTTNAGIGIGGIVRTRDEIDGGGIQGNNKTGEYILECLFRFWNCYIKRC